MSRGSSGLGSGTGLRRRRHRQRLGLPPRQGGGGHLSRSDLAGRKGGPRAACPGQGQGEEGAEGRSGVGCGEGARVGRLAG